VVAAPKASSPRDPKQPEYPLPLVSGANREARQTRPMCASEYRLGIMEQVRTLLTP
jgi:hypothetical protein